jgi:hypothetical protein
LPRCTVKTDSREQTFTELLGHLKNEVKELDEVLHAHLAYNIYREKREEHDMLEKICCECGDVINMASEIVDKIDAQMELGNAVT